MTALLKVKGNSWDVQPIAVGEVIRRLASKCACNVVKEKASDFFSPFQFGVACPRGSEKIIHNLREVLEQHWVSLILLSLKSTCRMLLILYLGMLFSNNALCTFQRFTHGPPGVTHKIQNFGILLVQCPRHQGFYKAILLALYCLL